MLSLSCSITIKTRGATMYNGDSNNVTPTPIEINGCFAVDFNESGIGDHGPDHVPCSVNAGDSPHVDLTPAQKM